MSKIGEYRLGVYELLYNHPICDYAEAPAKNAKHRQNVLILGSGWVGNEAFKACFWAGQALDSELNITVASENVDEYKTAIYGSGKFQGIHAFMHDYPDTRVEFISLKDGLNLERLDFESKHYNYIIISLGDANDNEDRSFNSLVAEEILKIIECIDYINKPLIAVFGVEKVPVDEQEELIQSKCAKVVFFDRKGVKEESELLRLAKNINFAYGMHYDERVPLKGRDNAADNKFGEDLNKEFINSPEDKDPGDVSITNNFYGKSYSADSSCASAVHISVKLSMCNLLRTKSNADLSPDEILADTVLYKSATDKPHYRTIYNRLLELEHRRWYAYMAMRGYHAPSTEEEEKRFLYKVETGTDHRDNAHLLHICMHRSDDQGVKLGKDVSKWAINLKDKKETAFLSELDLASLRAHKLATEASKGIKESAKKLISDFEQYVLSLELINNTLISDLCKAINKLINDDYNSVKLYEEAKANVDKSVDDEKKNNKDNAVVLAELDNIKSRLKEIDSVLKVVKERNKRVDFVAIDGQLIDFIPFCLFYRKKNQRVITITSGVPVKDVVIPTLFCAENATFLATMNDPFYDITISKYFKDRGDNIKPEFKRITGKNTFEKLLDDYQEELFSGRALLNLVDLNPELSIKIGQYMTTHDITVVTYHPIKGIQCLSGNKRFAAGLNNKSFSVEEIVGLIGGKRINKFDEISSENEREKLIELFKKHFVVPNQDSNGNAFIWNECSDFLKKASKDSQAKSTSKDQTSLIENEADKTVKRHDGKIPVHIFDDCKLEKWFKAIEKYRIIANYYKKENDGYYEISFDYCEKGLIENIVSKFECDASVPTEAYTTRVSFSVDGGIKLYDLKVENECLCNKEAKDEWKMLEKEACLRTLDKLGFISSLCFFDAEEITEAHYPMCKDCESKETCEKIKKHSVKRMASFRFNSKRSRWLLKQQGVPFEEITYHLFHNYGAFHDVQTGVKIDWERDKKPFETYLKEKMNDVVARFGQNKCGYYYYEAAKKAARSQVDNENWRFISNEIDIVATHGMTPIFCSCKTNKDFDNQWIYEIKSIADHFGAMPVMVVAQDCTDREKKAVIGRAKQMGVSMIGTETLWNNERLKRALEEIKNGKTVSVR